MNIVAWLTRREVAEQLGISVSSVRRLEGTTLHPVQDEHGVWRFDASTLDAVPARRQRRAVRRRRPRPGEVAARVFRLLDERRSLRDIVVVTRQPPELVRTLYRQWLVGLADGERARRDQEAMRRVRRQQVEDQRLHIEHMRAIRS